jgi:hypothetical protein
MEGSLTENKIARIRALNDLFRSTFEGGRMVLTQGVSSLGQIFILAALAEVKMFDAFTEENDPYGEHDFGSFKIEGRMLFWKISYYAPDMEHGSEDASVPEQTTRVLTIMLADEY